MLFTLAMLLVAVMANAKDIKTVVLTTNPIMHCANCEAKIKENLKFCKGIKSVETSVENQTVTIQYDADKASPETYIASLKKANYVATEKKACGGQKACDGKKACSAQKACDGKKACAGEQKSCCKESGEKKCDGGHCKGEAKCGKKCAGEQKSCCKEAGEKKCSGEQKTCCGGCKGEAKCDKKCEAKCDKKCEAKCDKKCDKKCEADATTGATKQKK